MKMISKDPRLMLAVFTANEIYELIKEFNEDIGQITFYIEEFSDFDSEEGMKQTVDGALEIAECCLDVPDEILKMCRHMREVLDGQTMDVLTSDGRNLTLDQALKEVQS
jgi:hypothetical protein